MERKLERDLNENLGIMARDLIEIGSYMVPIYGQKKIGREAKYDIESQIFLSMGQVVFYGSIFGLYSMFN